ncbi:MAG: metallophosphoesterase [Lachnospiraceae bacterium]|nr:metallophosphoesterase [Lachnospiraceae bacterium]
MSKVFVIPDVHLKPWMFEKASQLVSEGSYDAAVILGDLVDDWNQRKNLELYNQTFDAAIKFTEAIPNTFWCYGNHEIGYLWGTVVSGYSIHAQETVVSRMRDLRNSMPRGHSEYIHKLDKVIFSHAGLTESFVMRHFGRGKTDLDTMIAKINRMGEAEIWKGDSPIWARPQSNDYSQSNSKMRLYPQDLLQVVGHTPVKTAVQEENCLTVDSFSTNWDGEPVGDQRFVWVDTVEMCWGYAEE